MEHERGPDDVDQEMREVNRLLSKLPAADPYLGRGHRRSGAAQGTGGSFEEAGPPRPLATWIKVGLGIVFGVAVWQWPYANACGFGLMFYLVGVGTVVVSGLWCLVSSWSSRLGFAHFLSLVILLGGLTLTAQAVLPRIGYAAQLAVWRCAAPAAPVTPSPPAPRPPAPRR